MMGCPNDLHCLCSPVSRCRMWTFVQLHPERCQLGPLISVRTLPHVHRGKQTNRALIKQPPEHLIGRRMSAVRSYHVKVLTNMHMKIPCVAALQDCAPESSATCSYHLPYDCDGTLLCTLSSTDCTILTLQDTI
jgi:hypothetical protein